MHRSFQTIQPLADETYVKVAGIWRYVYRAVDDQGQIIDVMVSKTRDIAAARKFFNGAIRDHGRPRQSRQISRPRWSASSTNSCPRPSTRAANIRTTGSSATTAGSRGGRGRCAD